MPQLSLSIMLKGYYFQLDTSFDIIPSIWHGFPY